MAKPTLRISPFALHGLMSKHGLAEAGELHAGAVRVILEWQMAEPRPGAYRVEKFDDVLRRGQQHGVGFVVTLRPVSEWGVGAGARAATSGVPRRHCSAYPQKMDAWLRLVRFLGERYDGDGRADMPGLTMPIHYWQVENEWIPMWQGTPEEYVRFLAETSKALKEVNPRAQIIAARVGIPALAVAEGYGRRNYVQMDAAEGQTRTVPREAILASGRFRQYVEKTHYLLRHGAKYFDIVDCRAYSQHPDEIGAVADWMRATMKRFGFSKPIWFLEVGGPFHQYTPEQHAQDVVKRYVIGLSHGAERIFWSSLRPTTGWSEKFLRLALVDTQGRKTPAFYTYRLMTSKLGGMSSIEAVSVSGGLAVYRAAVNGRHVYVAWSDDVERTLSMPLPYQRAVITHVITQRGVTQPKAEQAPIVDGKLTVRVLSPVFIEPIGPPR